MIVPPPLRKGSAIRVIAPSSPFDRTLVHRGVAFLAKRYQVRCDPRIFEQEGYLAGSDDARLGELNQALHEPDTAAIVAARGGYGATRMSSLADFAALHERPKWLIGFSDVTALHVEAQRVGVASLHAHNLAGLGRYHPGVSEPWLAALEEPARPRLLKGRSSIQEGTARGVLLGGNLSVWFAAWAAGRVRLPPSFILALEDVDEATYRIDRMLTALLTAGVFDRAAGIALGDFERCPAGKYNVPVEVMLERCLGKLRLPIVTGLPFGHGVNNEPLTLGAQAVLDARELTLTTGLSI